MRQLLAFGLLLLTLSAHAQSGSKLAGYGPGGAASPASGTIVAGAGMAVTTSGGSTTITSTATGTNPPTVYYIYTYTKAAIQDLLTAIPATDGAIIRLSAGTYPLTTVTGQLMLNGKQNVTIEGIGEVRIISNDSEVSCFGAVNQCRNLTLRNIKFSNTATAATSGIPLLNFFWDSLLDNIEIDHCSFSNPNMAGNAITFTPYSPSNEGGVGQGNALRNANIHHCTFLNVGRIGCEVNAHTHADNKDEQYVFDFKFNNNTCTNLGVQDGYHGMGLSVGGRSTGVANNNTITNARFGGLEVVSGVGWGFADNWFWATDASFVFSAYAFSSNVGPNNVELRNRNFAISGGGGTVYNRPFTFYGTDYFSIKGGAWYYKEAFDIRARYGSVTGVTLTQFGGGPAVEMENTSFVTLSDCNISQVGPANNTYAPVRIYANSSNCNLHDLTMRQPLNSMQNFIDILGTNTHILHDNKLIQQ